MDSTQFDDLLRAIAARSSRRGIVASLVGSLVGILPLPPGTREAEAKKCPPVPQEEGRQVQEEAPERHAVRRPLQGMPRRRLRR